MVENKNKEICKQNQRSNIKYAALIYRFKITVKINIAKKGKKKEEHLTVCKKKICKNVKSKAIKINTFFYCFYSF